MKGLKQRRAAAAHPNVVGPITIEHTQTLRRAGRERALLRENPLAVTCFAASIERDADSRPKRPNRELTPVEFDGKSTRRAHVSQNGRRGEIRLELIHLRTDA